MVRIRARRALRRRRPAAFLSALGVATDTAATTDTPARMARAYAEMLSPRSFDLTTFANDEHYPDTPYVVDLVTCGVVNTMPEATLHAVADHGVLRGDTVIAGYHHAVEVMTALAEIGVDYDDVVDTLERDGLTTFQASWAALTETVERDRDALSLTALVHEQLAMARTAGSRPPDKHEL